jgi:hypothetical protein
MDDEGILMRAQMEMRKRLLGTGGENIFGTLWHMAWLKCVLVHLCCAHQKLRQ